MPNTQQRSRINDVLHYIHADINRDLSATKLANIARYSEQHFHRLFIAIVGESVNRYVRNTRLEIAANQLMFSPDTAIIEIAQKCGFQSLSSFNQAFKKQFNITPGSWRTDKISKKKPPYLSNPEIAAAYKRLSDTPLPDVKFVQLKARHVAYIRHLGYDRSIKKTWQILHSWALTHALEANKQLGLHHSNPAQTPLEKCHYVACIEIAQLLNKRGIVNSMTIPGGLYAQFEFSGKYGELLPSISKVLEQWLPSSSINAMTTPSFVEYRKNHFLNDNEQYDLSFYLPVDFY